MLSSRAAAFSVDALLMDVQSVKPSAAADIHKVGEGSKIDALEHKDQRYEFSHNKHGNYSSTCNDFENGLKQSSGSTAHCTRDTFILQGNRISLNNISEELLLQHEKNECKTGVKLAHCDSRPFFYDKLESNNYMSRTDSDKRRRFHSKEMSTIQHQSSHNVDVSKVPQKIKVCKSKTKKSKQVTNNYNEFGEEKYEAEKSSSQEIDTTQIHKFSQILFSQNKVFESSRVKEMDSSVKNERVENTSFKLKVDLPEMNKFIVNRGKFF